MLEPDLMVHIISYLCLIEGTRIEKVAEVLKTRKTISESFISAFWGAWQKFSRTFFLWAAHYPPHLKVPKRKTGNTHRGRTELKKKPAQYLSAHNNQQAHKWVLHSSFLIFTLWPLSKEKAVWWARGKQRKTPLFQDLINWEANKCTEASIPQAETGKVKKRKKILLKCQNFLLLISNGASAHL